MNNETNPLREAAETYAIDKWKDKNDYALDMCKDDFIAGAEWIQSQSLPAEQPEKEDDQLKKRCEAYRQQVYKLSEELAILKGEPVDFDGKLVQSSQFKQPSQPEGKTLEEVAEKRFPIHEDMSEQEKYAVYSRRNGFYIGVEYDDQPRKEWIEIYAESENYPADFEPVFVFTKDGNIHRAMLQKYGEDISNSEWSSEDWLGNMEFEYVTHYLELTPPQK